MRVKGRRDLRHAKKEKKHALCTPDRCISICACADQPRLAWTPADLQHPKCIFDRVPAEDLEWDDERVREEVVVHSCVEYLDRAVV